MVQQEDLCSRYKTAILYYLGKPEIHEFSKDKSRSLGHRTGEGESQSAS